MTEMVSVLVHGRWPLQIPRHRVHLWAEQPYWEVEHVASMHANLKPGDLVYDIGAEQGDMPALWASWGCDVVLVEPNPLVWPNMKATFEANKLVDKVRAHFVGFASDQTLEHPAQIETVIAVPDVDGWPACAHGPVVDDHSFRAVTQRAHDTPQIRIDDLVERVGQPPDAITMDVEGAELWVMRGARATLKNVRPFVWVSEHASFATQYDYDIGELHNYMADLRYTRAFFIYDHESHVLYVPNEKLDSAVLTGAR